MLSEERCFPEKANEFPVLQSYFPGGRCNPSSDYFGSFPGPPLFLSCILFSSISNSIETLSMALTSFLSVQIIGNQ